MLDEIQLKSELEEAISRDDQETIKIKSTEIENRRASRRRDMLTLGTCTVVKKANP